MEKESMGEEVKEFATEESDLKEPKKELDLSNPEDLRRCIEILNKNDQILQGRLIDAFSPLFQKIAEVEYKLEMLSRLEEKLFIKKSSETREYVQKVTLGEYKELAKICKRELDVEVERANQLKS